jgi:hypothetical protein
MPNANLFAAIHAKFPIDRDRVAIDIVDPSSGALLREVTWREIDTRTAQIAHLLQPRTRCARCRANRKKR